MFKKLISLLKISIPFKFVRNCEFVRNKTMLKTLLKDESSVKDFLILWIEKGILNWSFMFHSKAGFPVFHCQRIYRNHRKNCTSDSSFRFITAKFDEKFDPRYNDVTMQEKSQAQNLKRIDLMKTCTNIFKSTMKRKTNRVFVSGWTYILEMREGKIGKYRARKINIAKRAFSWEEKKQAALFLSSWYRSINEKLLRIHLSSDTFVDWLSEFNVVERCLK